MIFISLTIVCFAEESEFLGKFTLNTGFDIPAIGCKYFCRNIFSERISFNLVGTYAVRGTELTNRVVDEALTSGYRLFDSAQLYKNEKDLGQSFKHLLVKHNLTRSDIFITTKFCERNWLLFLKKINLIKYVF